MIVRGTWIIATASKPGYAVSFHAAHRFLQPSKDGTSNTVMLGEKRTAPQQLPIGRLARRLRLDGWLGSRHDPFYFLPARPGYQ